MTKTALIFSVCLLIVWGFLGTSATIAWFTDVTPTARNSFSVGDLDLKVSYRNDVIKTYTEVDSDTALFNDEALYEPGYTQVVYLKIENVGNVDFNYKLAIDKREWNDSINVYGSTFHLPNYLRFGVIFGESEAKLERELAQRYADKEMKEYLLNTYSEVDDTTVEAGKVRYAALIVYMPGRVGNEANYHRDYDMPWVKLGMTVYAQQEGTPME